MIKNPLFYPKIITSFKNYSLKQLPNDLVAGVVVGIVAIPLAIAFGIASGVKPEQGLITAIIAGFIVSALGGSRVQIGGPTGAFVVIVYNIIAKYGLDGLVISTIMAGFILIAMGVARLGNLIKFIPTPLIVGFTSGIAVVIFSSQIRDFLGIPVEKIPPNFFEKWAVYFQHLDAVNFWAVGIALFTILIIISIVKYFSRIPGAFVALAITTTMVYLFDIPVDTIGSRYGDVSGSIPMPHFPDVSYTTIRQLIVPAFTIAVLAAIESLLSAVVADGMIGGKHRSNTELIAQGVANVLTPIFGGIPATGAIARTATNIRMGGRTPLAGIIHALVLFGVIMYAGKLVAWIPMSTLAGILIVVSYNMSEWREFKALFSAPKPDIAVLLLTFTITVAFDLTIAIEIGMILSAFMFMHRMAEVSDIRKLCFEENGENGDDNYYDRPEALSKVKCPSYVEVFEANGAFFYGAADKFETILRQTAVSSKYIILRMNNVYVLDATGIKVLSRFAKDIKKNNTQLMLSELHYRCLSTIEDSNFINIIGRDNIFRSLQQAVDAIEVREATVESEENAA